MIIDDLNIGELRQLIALLNTDTLKPAQPHPFVGKYCIARCYSAGVHAGEVVSVDGENVILKNSIRLWSWKATEGIALSGVAQNGIDRSKSKLDVVNPEIFLTGVCELIPCTQKAQESIHV
jgi:hypothetical protein